MTLVLNGTTGVSSVDGSASTPAIQGNDTNTGVFFPAADTVAIATGGTERVRTDSSGNVGIGTSSPATKLDVSGPASVISFTGTTKLGVTVRGSTAATDYSGIDFIGNSQTNPVARIAVLTTGGGSSLSFGTSNSYGSGITNTAATIDSSGNLLVGTTSINPGLGNNNIGCMFAGGGYGSVSRADTAWYVNYTGAGTGQNVHLKWQGTTVGNISTTSTATAYNTSSDYRLKENIQPMTGALARVSALKPVTYKWKVDGSDGEGFIAHELQEIVPQAVTGEKDEVDSNGSPRYQGIDTSFLVATLTAAIQEQQALIESLTARIAALEAK